SGNGIVGLTFNQSGGYVPPDTDAAAGPSSIVETVNQEVAIFSPKSTGAAMVSDNLGHFLFTVGGFTRAAFRSGQSDPVVAFDELIGRFIIGDQDVDFNSHVSAFDVAVSKSNNPTTLTAADWAFFLQDYNDRDRFRRRFSGQFRLQPGWRRIYAEHVWRIW